VAIRAGANAIGFVFAPSPRRITPSRARAISARVHPSVRRIGVFVDEDPARVVATAADARLDGAQLHGSEPAEVIRAVRQAAPRLFLIEVIRMGGPQPLSLGVELRAEGLVDAVMVDTKDPADLAAAPVVISSRISASGGTVRDSGGPKGFAESADPARAPILGDGGREGAPILRDDGDEPAAVGKGGRPGPPGLRVDRLVLAGGLTPDNVGELVRRIRPWGVDVSSGVESAPGRKDPGKVRAFVQAVREAEGA
jgi:phosphoribosylanthranilate isomerase